MALYAPLPPAPTGRSKYLSTEIKPHCTIHVIDHVLIPTAAKLAAVA
jgi:hypothetical protein